MFGQGGYLHYTSPRFLKEAKKDAEQIINHFNQTFASLMAARHQETKNMHKRLLLAEEDKEAASAALAVAQEAERDAVRQAEEAEWMRDLHAEEIAAQSLELEALRARLALAQRKNSMQ
jgi:glycogen debranching enzyme